MTDYFAVLGEDRRPWIDPEMLKQKFLARSAEAHPDRVHSANEAEKQKHQRLYIELNAAYQCLREPKARLLHLLELETGAKPGQIQRIPPELMDLSLEAGQLCREADAVLKEKAGTTSPLLQVQVFDRAQRITETLSAFLAKLESLRDGVLGEIKAVDARWTNPENVGLSELLARLERFYSLLSYYERWVAQVRERIVQLSF
jgi:DnaJ-domain-containing protein 1